MSGTQNRAQQKNSNLFEKRCIDMDIKIVAGAPGAGKNTFVNRSFQNGDILIDLDKIYEAISNTNSHCEKDSEILKVALKVRGFLYEYIRRYVKNRNVWVIACLPNGRKREMLSRSLRDAKVYLIKSTAEQCIKNIKNDSRRTYSDKHAKKIVDQWFSEFSASRKDCIVSWDEK